MKAALTLAHRPSGIVSASTGGGGGEAPPPPASVIHVDQDLAAAGDGSLATPYNTLSAALSAALSATAVIDIALHAAASAYSLTSLSNYSFPFTTTIRPHTGDTVTVTNFTITACKKLTLKDLTTVNTTAECTIVNGGSAQGLTADITIDNVKVKGRWRVSGACQRVTLKTCDNVNNPAIPTYFTVPGRWITADNRVGQAFPYANAQTDLTVVGNKVIGLNDDPIFLVSVNGVLIENNDFGSSPADVPASHADGVHLSSGSGIVIRNNRLFSIGWQGIFLTYHSAIAPNFPTQDVEIYNNLIYCCDKTAVEVSSTEPILAKVTADGANTVTVDTVASLQVGMAIDIIRQSDGVVLASNRTISSINTSTKVVTYSGADVAATTGHRLVKTGQWSGFPHNIWIYNNTMWNNTIGAGSGDVFLERRYGGQTIGSVYVWNNIMERRDYADYTPTVANHNRVNVGQTNGANDVTATPAFDATAPTTAAGALADYNTGAPFPFNLVAGDMALINAGNPAAVGGKTAPTTDFDGTARSGNPDIGAQEKV